jgi:hypothetical protein
MFYIEGLGLSVLYSGIVHLSRVHCFQ